MSNLTSALSTSAVRRSSSSARLNVAGLVVAAGGMLLQMAAGSTLYPSVAGPVVLLVTAGVVAVAPGRWPPYVGLAVPAVLGVGAIVAAVMTGDFFDQLGRFGVPVLVLGSVLHIVGLAAAVAGGIGMVVGSRTAGASER